MIPTEPPPFFRGSERSRLITLVVISILGACIVWTAAVDDAPANEPPARAGDPPATIAPDTDPAFESVSDKTRLGFRDTAAYRLLLDRARATTPANLAAQAHRDIHLAQVYERPGHYRGVPIHLLGTARRILRYESKLSPSGWLHEAWIFTPDGQNYPFVCVFEEAPPDLPIGSTLSERVVFNGYFLKLMRYDAADVPRAAPLLVGRIGWTPAPPSGGVPGRRSLQFWLAAIVAMLFLVSLFRWVRGLKRALTPRSSRTAVRPVPNEEIAPEALAQWVDTVADDAERLRELGAHDEESAEDTPSAP